MAKLNLEYCTKDIEDAEDMHSLATLYNIVKEGRTVDELVADEWTYPVLFHLSNTRQNVLNWYEFVPKSTILEVGSECGALTGLLCQKGKQVVSLERSRTMAQINYMRNQAYDNLEIIVAELKDISLDTQYDYIVVNGGSDYILASFGSKDAYKMALKYLLGALKDSGRIIFIVDNQLATKYFSGTPDEYTGNYFEEINNSNGTLAMSKMELLSCFETVGLKCNKFYYPYPDYRFPNEIFTDDTIYSDMYGKNCIQFQERKVELFSEQQLIEVLKKERIIDKFVNSFIVELSKEKINSERKDIKYVKLNSDRNKKFQISTVVCDIDGERMVYKQALNEESKKHLQEMYQYGCRAHSDAWSTLTPQLETDNSCLKYKWIHGDSYDKYFEKCIDDKNIEGMIREVLRVKDTFLNRTQDICPYQNDIFCRVFSNPMDDKTEVFPCVSSGNIDIILSNIFEVENKPCVIDYEWNFDCPIPVEYIMWRIVDALYSEHKELSRVIALEEFQKKLGIRLDYVQLFRRWENNFVFKYVGSNRLYHIAKDGQKIDLESIVDHRIAKTTDVRLYIDRGNGFTATDYLEKKVDISRGIFEVEFCLNTIDWVQLRFDPADCACEVSEVGVSNGKHELKITPVNAYKSENFDIFLNNDPNYLIMSEYNEVIDKIIINGHIKLLSEQKINELQMRIFAEQQTLDSQREQLKNQVQLKEQHIGNLENIIASMEEERRGILKQNEKLVSENSELTVEKQEFLNELGRIKGSRLYRLYELKDKVKKK